MSTSSIVIPADVPAQQHTAFVHNYNMMTHHTNQLLLFTGDHKIEHLNNDFVQPSVSADARDPEHLFRIAAHGSVGAFATQLGLIARYGRSYPNIPYVAKLNSKSNIIPTIEHDPLSGMLATVDDVLRVAESGGLEMCGIGVTVYLGSTYEPRMLHEAAEAVLAAHYHGLVAIVWLYPRGQHVENQFEPQLLAGAAGVAACLGADFVKLTLPAMGLSAAALSDIVIAAGRTRVICAGGEKIEPFDLLTKVAFQLEHGIAGAAIGRNIYQHSLAQACAMTDALSALVYQGADLATAQSYLRIK